MFYAGGLMQASVVETEARWSHPPYGGIVYSDKPGITFKQKSEEENRSLYVPEDAPEYGKCTEYTDDAVLQRRLMIMMDDYVVLADYLKAGQEHTFDWLMQIKGFKGLQGVRVEKTRHDKQMNPDPRGAAGCVQILSHFCFEVLCLLKLERYVPVSWYPPRQRRGAHAGF